MDLNKKDKEMIKEILKKELAEVKEEGSNILRPQIAHLAAEEKYEDYLEKLIKKID